MTFTDEVVQRVKSEAMNLEGMYTSHEEYVKAMNDLIAYFIACREEALADFSDYEG